MGGFLSVGSSFFIILILGGGIYEGGERFAGGGGWEDAAEGRVGIPCGVFGGDFPKQPGKVVGSGRVVI